MSPSHGLRSRRDADGGRPRRRSQIPIGPPEAKRPARRAFRLLQPGMAPRAHDSARAGSAARGGAYSRFEHKLRERWRDLGDETREALSRSDNETYADIAGRVTDLEDQSLADLPVDVNPAEVTRDVQEICQRAYERDHATTPTPRL